MKWCQSVGVIDAYDSTQCGGTPLGAGGIPEEVTGFQGGAMHHGGVG